MTGFRYWRWWALGDYRVPVWLDVWWLRWPPQSRVEIWFRCVECGDGMGLADLVAEDVQ